MCVRESSVSSVRERACVYIHVHYMYFLTLTSLGPRPCTHLFFCECREGLGPKLDLDLLNNLVTLTSFVLLHVASHMISITLTCT